MFNTIAGAVLLALLVMLPALALFSNFKPFGDIQRKPLHGFFRTLWRSEVGAVVVTYCTPIGGTPSTTPLAANQASQVPEQTATISWQDADTQAIFVHNWGLPNSFPTFLFPMPIMVKLLGASGDPSFATAFTFGLTNTNQVYITKQTLAAGGTYAVYLRKPHSIGF